MKTCEPARNMEFFIITLILYQFSMVASFGLANGILNALAAEKRQLYLIDVVDDIDFSLVNAATESFESGSTTENCIVFCGTCQSPALYHTGAGSAMLLLPNDESRVAFLQNMVKEWDGGPLTLASRYSHGKDEETIRGNKHIEVVDPSVFLETFRQSEAAMINECDIMMTERSIAKSSSYNEQIRLLKHVVRLRDDRIKILREKGRVQKPKKRRVSSARDWTKQTKWQQVPIAQEPHRQVQELIRTESLPFHTKGRDLDSRIWKVKRRSTRLQEDNKPIRLVVLSDTHSMEDQLKLPLPDADILIHCGDYAQDPFSPSTLPTYLKEHAAHIPVHLVIRGNHDPLVLGKSAFSERTIYATKQATITLPGGLVADLRPFNKSRKKQPPIAPDCDLVISHEPPFGLLDETYQKDRVGSISLRLAAEVDVPPPLWLCGHIHEGRGATQFRRWQSSSTSATTTLVMNASNANPGKADQLIAGPVIIDIVPASPTMGWCKVRSCH